MSTELPILRSQLFGAGRRAQGGCSDAQHQPRRLQALACPASAARVSQCAPVGLSTSTWRKIAQAQGMAEQASWGSGAHMTPPPEVPSWLAPYVYIASMHSHSQASSRSGRVLVPREGAHQNHCFPVLPPAPWCPAPWCVELDPYPGAPASTWS